MMMQTRAVDDDLTNLLHEPAIHTNISVLVWRLEVLVAPFFTDISVFFLTLLTVARL
jgi:hypothetical protein